MLRAAPLGDQRLHLIRVAPENIAEPFVENPDFFRDMIEPVKVGAL